MGHAQDAGMDTSVGGAGREGRGQDEGLLGTVTAAWQSWRCGWCRLAGGQGRVSVGPSGFLVAKKPLTHTAGCLQHTPREAAHPQYQWTIRRQQMSP